jgi:hypothetical protein
LHAVEFALAVRPIVHALFHLARSGLQPPATAKTSDEKERGSRSSASDLQKAGIDQITAIEVQQNVR